MDKYRYIDAIQFRISENDSVKYNLKYIAISNLVEDINSWGFNACITENTNESISFIVYDVDTEQWLDYVLTNVNKELDKIVKM